MTEFFTKNAEYLLGRETRQSADRAVSEYFAGKTVMVTGGGGSIGSELCVCAARHGAERVVILDINENNAHEVNLRLEADCPETKRRTVIASVRDRARVLEIFEEIRPDVVFHAAAHKHVSFMEQNPREAVKNTIIGTINAADAAEKAGASAFVLVSTDKAVEPTSVMGATKRFCEYVVASRGDSKTKFAAVRFGNVLGSAGSVLPDFVEKIKRGEVINITSRTVERYFMSIPEAAELVLCAASMEKGGIYVLDMGEPVKIAELAMRLGKILCRDVQIEYTSLGDGDKLTERLSYGGLEATDLPFIAVEHCEPIPRDEISRRTAVLEAAMDDDGKIREALRTVVCEYSPR